MSRESLFNDIWRACDIMRRDDGTTGILEYMEQLSWMLFLKAFEAIESRYEAEATIYEKSYDRIFRNGFRWSEWTKKDTGEIMDFVNNHLFPYLRELSGTPEKTIIATIFREIPYNRMKSPL
ncbi:MAG TPA: hypothetical protein EYP21_03970 [Syntrophaceae bacterium]|nr:hypothetical protein [Syntrophaceae bacterium]